MTREPKVREGFALRGERADVMVRKRVRTAVALVVLGSLLATAFVVYPGAAALAACGTARGIVGVNDDGEEHFGSRVSGPGLLVSDYSVTYNCYIVRSVYVYRDANNFVEVGWVEDTQGVSTGCDPAPEGPRAFAYAMVQGSVALCSDEGALPAGEYHGFRVENPDHNYYWTYYIDGDLVAGSGATNMWMGKVYSGAERRNNDDNNHAVFDGVKWMGAADSWNVYDPLVGGRSGPENEFVFCKDSNHKWRSELSC
jgi:hypothetical protein